MADLSPTIRSNGLPAKYEAAKVALAECIRVDECKDWADTAAALATYGRQSRNKELEIYALQIRLRAIRRTGEILLTINTASGARKDLEPRVGNQPRLTREEAATKAGLSKHQAKEAIRVARIGTKSFEQQIESPKPPSVTKLAQEGKKKTKPKPTSEPLYKQLGMTIKAFQAGMYFRGDVETYIKAMGCYDIDDIVSGTVPDDRDAFRKDLDQIEKYNAKLKSKL